MHSDSLPPLDAQVSLDTDTAKRNVNTKPTVIAAFSSAVIPGLGQLLYGNKSSGVVFLCIAGVLFLGFWPLRLPRYYAGFFLVLVWSGLNIAASWNALRTKTVSRKAASYLWLLALLPISVFFALLCSVNSLRLAGLKEFNIPSTAMENTLYPGDVFMSDMHAYKHASPKDGDIVLFNRGGKTVFIKRVIASRGEEIQGISNQIFVNGKKLDEPYSEHIGGAPPELVNFGPVLVPAGKLFVIGDNRDISLDSRTYGAIDGREIMGKVLYLIRTKQDRTGKTIR